MAHKIDNYYYKNKRAKNPITDTGEIYKHDNIYNIYIYVFVVTVYMTIFFFTLTTNVAHGDVKH